MSEIIAQVLGIGPDTKGVAREYDRLVACYGTELRILLDLSLEELAEHTPPAIHEGIRKARAGDLTIEPGYDGVFGRVRIPIQSGQTLI